MQMTVWKKDKGTYKVASETTEGTHYRVRETKDVWVCSCPRFTNDHNIAECKHIKRVKEAIELEKDPLVLAYDVFPEGGIIDDTPMAQVKRDLSDAHRKIGSDMDRLNELIEKLG